MSETKAPYHLALIRDAVGQAGLAGGAKFEEGLRVGSTGVPAHTGDLWLEHSIRRSTALSAGASGEILSFPASVAWQAVTLDAEVWDTDNLCDLANLASGFTVRTGGVYLVAGSLAFDPNSTGLRGIAIAQNGNLIAWRKLPALAAAIMGMAITTLWQAAEGDTFELKAYHNQPGALGATGPRFSACRLA